MEKGSPMVQKKLEKSIDLGILKTLKGGGNKKVDLKKSE